MDKRTIDKYKLIMKEEELKRIKEITVKGQKAVSLDLHNMKTHRAKTLAQNFLLLTPPGIAVLIHGYRRGSATKDAVSDIMSRRIISRNVPEYNPGITIFELAA